MQATGRPGTTLPAGVCTGRAASRYPLGSLQAVQRRPAQLFTATLPGCGLLGLHSLVLNQPGSRAVALCLAAAAVLARTARGSSRRKRCAVRQMPCRAAAADETSGREDLEAFLRAQRNRPPTTDPLEGPLTAYNDNPFDFFFIAIFRLVMTTQAKFRSTLPWWGPDAYNGMLEVAHAMQWKKSLQEVEDSSIGVIEQLVGENGKRAFREALKPDRFGTELNAWITAAFFPFMVGELELEDRTHKDFSRIPEGESWKCAVKIKKCRWLERSGCVGMCVGLCKKPMERMFGGVLGMPLSMEPNMEDLSCTMVFGKDPEDWAKDEVRKQPCFKTCATARKTGGACPKLS